MLEPRGHPATPAQPDTRAAEVRHRMKTACLQPSSRQHPCGRRRPPPRRAPGAPRHAPRPSTPPTLTWPRKTHVVTFASRPLLRQRCFAGGPRAQLMVGRRPACLSLSLLLIARRICASQFLWGEGGSCWPDCKGSLGYEMSAGAPRQGWQNTGGYIFLSEKLYLCLPDARTPRCGGVYSQAYIYFTFSLSTCASDKKIKYLREFQF